MRSARILVVLALAAGLTGLTACGSGSGDPHVSARKNQPRVIAAGEGYVAMGDSYTAAPYTGPTTADDGCLQSATNYPHLVAAKLGLKLTDVSCGGATTSSITGPQKTSTTTKPPQLDALSPTTALVTVSIGGNDGGVFGAASSICLGVTGQAAAQGSTAPCTELDGIAHSKGTGTSDRIAAMEKSLVTTLRAVITRAPKARLLVVSYPHTLPSQTCAQFPLAAGDAAWATRVNEELVEAQRSAAKAVGAEFVDMYAISSGHDMCGSDPWEAGEHPTAAAAPFHPYPVEQSQVADAIERTLASNPRP